MAPKPAGVGLRKPTHSKAAKEKGTTRAVPMKPPVMKAEEVEPPVIRPKTKRIGRRRPGYKLTGDIGRN